MSRILITGSRNWDDRAAIEHALINVMSRYSTIGPRVLVHGACPYGGADALADEVWRRWQATEPWGRGLADPETHPLDRYGSPRDRNQAMVDAGATACVAFAARWASGTGQTARMARRAGIPVWDYGVDTSPEWRP